MSMFLGLKRLVVFLILQFSFRVLEYCYYYNNVFVLLAYQEMKWKLVYEFMNNNTMCEH